MPAKRAGISGRERGRTTTKKRGSGSSLSVSPSARKRKRRKKTTTKEMPDWLYWTLASFFVLIFMYGFYRVVIAPYSFRWKPCYGSRAFGICLPSEYRIFGIDVSHHQGDIDWKKVATIKQDSYSISFAIIKATEGGDFKDSKYDTNILAARNAGLICGAYHYYKPYTSPKQQAEFFIKNVTLLPGDLPPVIDVEEPHTGSKVTLQRELMEFISILERHYNVQPIIYSSAKFWERYLKNGSLDSYPFWVAHHHTEQPQTKRDWIIWQYSDYAEIDGIDEDVDLNIFRGEWNELKELLIK